MELHVALTMPVMQGMAGGNVLLYSSAPGLMQLLCRLQPANFTAGPNGHAPFAVYDVSHGTIFINRRLAAFLHLSNKLVSM